MAKKPVRQSPSRREFLKTSGALVVSTSMTGFSSAALAQARGAMPLPVPGELDAWVAVHPDGRISAYFGKIDMGQSLEVAIAQIVAEELDVPVERVAVLMGDTATSCNQGGASSALGIQAGAKPLRNAAAEARRILVEMASQRLGVPAAQLSVGDGVVAAAADASKRVSYAELIGGRKFGSKVEWNKQVGNQMDIRVRAKPKSPSEYRIVGKSVPRRDVAWKVFGTGDFVTEISLPNMLHGRVIRPTQAGCLPVSVDEGSIRSIRGARVVRVANFLAVVAEREWDAVRAARELKVQWSASQSPFPLMEQLHAHIRSAKPLRREEPVKRGNVDAAFKSAARVVEAEYEWPFQSHASMGPGCALADVRAEGATVWTGSQKPHYTQEGVAAMLGLALEKVHVIWVPGPGSYGRNDAGDTALDAVLLSRLTRRPVRVQYMQADGIAWDPKAPASVHKARAALDDKGAIVAYDFLSRGFSRNNINSNESDPGDSLAGMELGLPLKPLIGYGTPAESYGFPSKRLAWEVIPPLLERSSPLRTSHMRDPLGPETHFASEQFMDELAAATGMDPVAFRLKHLTAPRDIAVVKAAAEKSGWQARPVDGRERSGDVLVGRGIAYAQRAGTVLAVVAEIEVERRTGRIWGRKFTVAHDCGLVVNPMGLRHTIECGLVQSLSRTLFEEVRFDRNGVTSVDWASYPIVDMQAVPESVEIVLMNRPEAAPTGAGEPITRCVPAAVANAFFDATGVRMRKAPLTPERVKAALARA